MVFIHSPKKSFLWIFICIVPVFMACKSSNAQNSQPNAATISPSQQQKLTKLLAVHRALSEGLDLLRKGRHEEAVTQLEKELPNIEGDREYLRTLQDAYQGAIQDLARSGHAVEADAYIRRLSTLQAPNQQYSPNPLGLSKSANAAPIPIRLDSQPTDINPLTPVSKGPPAIVSAVPVPGFVGTNNSVDDPFSPANFDKPIQKILPALRDAETAFLAAKYNQAAGLYDRAYRQGEALEGIQQERWGYCKLAALVESFNKGQVHEAMIIEADQAVTLSPKLSGVAGKVKSQVLASLSQTGQQAEAVEKVEIKRVQGNGIWQAVESSWFRVFHQNNEEIAVQVARQADAAKASASRRWLGTTGEHWPFRCDIWLYPTGEMYSRATGVAGNSPGHSTFQAESTRVLGRKIELRMDHPNLLDAVLPHEVTHVVLAGQFGKNFLPRWLDEGMAILAEPRERIRRHTDHIPRYATEGSLLNSGQLITLSDYPDASKVGIFYAQSVSLVEYLCSLKGTQAFTLFVKDAVGGNWEAALKHHYSIDGFAGLDRQWRGDWVALGNPK